MAEMPGQLALWKSTADLPWDRPVLVEVAEEFWSDDWLRGVRSKTYLGMLCSHFGPELDRHGNRYPVCVQPRCESQAAAAPCVPFDWEHAKITALEGKLKDYA
jgi:hypothetical protein